MTATVRDVARLAAVSPQTVSNVYRHPHRVSELTLLRVRSAALELGFVPTLAAQRLRGRLLPVVGVVAEGLQEPSVREVLAHVDSVCWAFGLTTQTIDIRSELSMPFSIEILRGLGASAVLRLGHAQRSDAIDTCSAHRPDVVVWLPDHPTPTLKRDFAARAAAIRLAEVATERLLEQRGD